MSTHLYPPGVRAILDKLGCVNFTWEGYRVLDDRTFLYVLIFEMTDGRRVRKHVHLDADQPFELSDAINLLNGHIRSR